MCVAIPLRFRNMMDGRILHFLICNEQQFALKLFIDEIYKNSIISVEVAKLI